MVDDKYAKFAAQNSGLIRRVSFYALLGTYVADAYASHGASMMHLTLWSWFLHTLYFELHIPSSSTSVRLLHGPSFCGAHALFAMYLWTLFANPNMEFDLAPEGRADWLILARAFWLHAGPVLLHWVDWTQNASLIQKAYIKHSTSRLLQFWASVGGYFAMGLTWEQVNGDSAGTYNVTKVSPEVYVNVSKAAGILACILSFFFVLRPKLFK